MKLMTSIPSIMLILDNFVSHTNPEAADGLNLACSVISHLDSMVQFDFSTETSLVKKTFLPG
jgi:hypothetical protein